MKPRTTEIAPGVFRQIAGRDIGKTLGAKQLQGGGEDLVFAVRELGEAQAAYLQKLIEVCGACDALCECRAARVEETDALRRLPPKLLRELWEKGVCIRNLGRALASGAFLYDARNIRKRGTEHETHGETQ